MDYRKQWNNMWTLVFVSILLKYLMRVLARETGYVEWDYLQLFFVLVVPIVMGYYAYKLTGKRVEILVNGTLGLLQFAFIGPLVSYVWLKRKLAVRLKAAGPRGETQQNGFAFLPVLIVVAVVALLGGSGATIYQIQKNNEAETSALRQELQEIQKEKAEVDQPIEAEEEQSEPTPSESPTELSEPEVKAAITKAPAVTTKAPQAVSNETNIPLIVEEEFTKAYGRKPTSNESTEWKNKFRANNWTRTDLYNAIVAAKPTTTAQQNQSNQKQTAPTNIVVQPNTNSNSEQLSKYLLDKYQQDEQQAAAQRQLEAAIVAEQAREREACVANYNNKQAQLQADYEAEIKTINNNPYFSEALRTEKVRLATQKYESNRAGLVSIYLAPCSN